MQPIKLKSKKEKSNKCQIDHDYGFEKFSYDKESNDIVRNDDDNIMKYTLEETPKVTTGELVFEGFELDPDAVDREKYESKLCKFKDDTGWICPIHYNHDNGQKILPYQECSKEIQEEVCKYLLDEWAEEAKIDDLEETHYYITRNWSAGDIMYVLINEKKDKLLGFVAIDRKQFYPFISHLYVTPKNRKKGYGKLLMDFSIEYIKILGFTQGKLWCRKGLVPYYENYGWEIESDKNPKAIVMIKNI